MKTTLRTILQWSLRRLADSSPETRGQLICAKCGEPVRRHDKYKIVAAAHTDCSDPRLIEQRGQLQLPEIRTQGEK